MALNEELTEHLGHEKNLVPDWRETTNVRIGTRSKTVLTDAVGKHEMVLSLMPGGVIAGEIAAHFEDI